MAVKPFKELPGQAGAGQPPLKPAVTPPGAPNVNPVLSLSKTMPGVAKRPGVGVLPDLDNPGAGKKPASPGKSASAPGQIKKRMGLPNASTIAPGKIREDAAEDKADKSEGSKNVMKGMASGLGTIPSPAIPYAAKKKSKAPRG